MRRSAHHFLALSLATSLLALVADITAPAIAAGVLPERIFELDIPRTTRARALQAISQQSGIGVIYYSNEEERDNRLVGPIKGRITLKTALSMALHSSTLTYAWIKSDMLSVVEAPPTEREPTQPAEPLVESGVQEEIMVTTEPVRGAFSQAASAVIIDQDRIDAIGAQSIPDVLRQISQSAYSRAEGFYASGPQYAEMRGLGPETVLILINGRRAFPSANSIASNAFDLNSIPISAIERIEILPNMGSALYGAEGIAGIINIVLREKINSPSISVHYGGADGGARQRGATLVFGNDGKRFKSTVVVDYLELDGLLGEKRSRWRDQDYRRFGGLDRRSLISAPGNVVSVTGDNLPGLSSSIAAVPLTDTTPGISRDDFTASAGTAHLESLLGQESIVPETTRANVAGTATYSINDHITASADLLYSQRSTTFYLPSPMLGPAVVPASNAYNPFGTTVLVYRLLPELGPQYQDIETQLARIGVTLHGQQSTWHWKVSALHSQENASALIHNALDLTSHGAVMRALASPDPDQAINLFQSGPIAHPALLDQLMARRTNDAFSSTGQQLVAYVEGNLWQLPAGSIIATVGGEWRRESSLFDTDQIGRFNRDRNITSAFMQLRVPLVKNAPAKQELWLIADSRLDHYSGIGSAVHSQYGLQWRPHQSWNMHASRSHTFRPPSLYELYLPRVDTQARVLDPARRESALASVTIGGNPSLTTATAHSWTAGFAFTPETAMNWHISADYWQIAAQDLVLVLPPATVLAHELIFPERVTRAQPTQAEVQAGMVGRLQSVDSSRINTARLDANGIDFVFRADIQTGMGRFTPELRATWFDTFRSSDIPGQPLTDRVNVASEYGSILQWRAIASLQWRRGPYGLATSARWTPSYNDALAGELTGRKVHSQTLFDLHGSINFEHLFDAKALLGGRLTAGVFNLLDAEPGYSEVGSAFDLSQGDLKGRSYYLRFEKKI